MKKSIWSFNSGRRREVGARLYRPKQFYELCTEEKNSYEYLDGGDREEKGTAVPCMEVEYSGGGVLISSYLILIHQLDDLGGLCDNFGSDFIGCRFDGPPIACKRGLRVAS